ncbi:hypothetical protein D3C85_400360 [compost metagenome]
MFIDLLFSSVYLNPDKLIVPAFLMFSYWLFSTEAISNSVVTSAFKIPAKGLSILIGYAFERFAKLIVPFKAAFTYGFIVMFLIFALALKTS